MKYIDIMKWFPKFLPAKNSMVPDYCKHIAFCPNYTAVTNGFCLVVDAFTSHPHMEDKQGRQLPLAEVFEQNTDRTLLNFKPAITKQLDYETLKYWSKHLSCMSDVLYIQLADTMDVFQSHMGRQVRLSFSCTGETTESTGGLFSGTTLTNVTTMLQKTSPSTEKFTISLSGDNRPILKLASTETTIILAGLRPVKSIQSSGIVEWLKQCGVTKSL